MSERTAREELDRILELVGRVFSFWKRALLVFVLTCAVAVPIALTRPRTYKSETVVLYQDNMTSSLTGEGGGSEAGRRVGARLREVLLSRASLEPIITEVHVFDQLVERRGMVQAVEELRKQITFRAREGDTFEISYVGSSPDEVQEVTRRLADCIVREAATRRAEQAKALKAFVDAESERNQIDLKTKEAALASFLAAHPEFVRIAAAEAQGGTAAPPGSPTSTAGGRTPSSDPALAALEARAARLEAQLAPPQTAPTAPTAAPPPRQESPELVAARRDLADKLARYTEKHPDVAAARARLKAAEEAEAAAIKAAAANAPPAPAPEPAAPQRTEAEREALRRELNQVQAQIIARRQQLAAARASGTAAPAPSQTPIEEASVTLAVEYRRLAREVADARERQRQLDDKQFKASITASSATNDRNIQVTVLDPAYRPTHAISRPRSILLGIALAICLTLAILTAFASALFDDRIHRRVDLERLDVLPVVGAIPRALPPRRS